MIEPISISIATISLIGSVVIAIIQLFRGINCENAQSNCCSTESEIDIHDNSRVRVGK